MKSIIKFLGIAFIATLTFVSCDSNPSLQKYYVDSKENVSEDVKKTLETVKKVNFLALQLTETNEALYTSEKLKVNAILKNPKYKQLMRMNMGKGNVSVNYLGEEDAIDEVILFGSDNNKGFAVVRIIGENMNPNDIMKILWHSV